MIEAGATVLFGKCDSGEANLGGFAKSFAREAAGLVDFARVGLYFGVGEFAHRLLQKFLFFAEFEVQFISRVL